MREDAILVVKLGGGAGLDVTHVCADLARIATQRPVVVVHGVSAMMAQLSAERGLNEQMLTSPTGHSFRYTDPQTRDLFVEAARQVNQQVRDCLNAYGVRTIDLFNPPVIRGTRKAAVRAVVDGRIRIIHDDYSGTISGVDGATLHRWLNAGVVPVVPPLAVSEDGLLNIDGDRASAAVASTLHAGELVILSNVRGLYRHYPDESSFVEEVSLREVNSAMDWAQGRMKRKVLGAQEALEGGAGRVIIGDGRVTNPVTQALNGAGTVFTS